MVEPATAVVVTWEVMNRFRLFRDERDFRRHVEAENGRSALEAEQDMAEATEGRGWAAAVSGCWAKAADTPKKIAATDTTVRFNDIDPSLGGR